MKTVNQNHMTISFMALVAAIVTIFYTQQSFADPNSGRIIELGQETNKITCLAESVYWPDFDFKNAASYIVEPNLTKKTEFTKFASQIVNANYLPQDLAEKIRFLKGWEDVPVVVEN